MEEKYQKYLWTFSTLYNFTFTSVYLIVLMLSEINNELKIYLIVNIVLHIVSTLFNVIASEINNNYKTYHILIINSIAGIFAIPIVYHLVIEFYIIIIYVEICFSIVINMIFVISCLVNCNGNSDYTRI